MVVGDFDIIRVSVLPDETYTPLVINGNGMLPGAVVLERMEPVAGRVAQIVKRTDAVEHPQPIECAVLDVGRQFAAAQAGPDAFGFGVGEGVDHRS